MQSGISCLPEATPGKYQSGACAPLRQKVAGTALLLLLKAVCLGPGEDAAVEIGDRDEDEATFQRKLAPASDNNRPDEAKIKVATAVLRCPNCCRRKKVENARHDATRRDSRIAAPRATNGQLGRAGRQGGKIKLLSCSSSR